MNRKKKVETPVKKTAICRALAVSYNVPFWSIYGFIFFSCYLAISALGNVIKSVNFLSLKRLLRIWPTSDLVSQVDKECVAFG